MIVIHSAQPLPMVDVLLEVQQAALMIQPAILEPVQRPTLDVNLGIMHIEDV